MLWVLLFLPMVLLNRQWRDAVGTTALATAAGSAGDYLEGSFLENNENKKVAQYGEALKENALSPSTLAANGGNGTPQLNLWAKKGQIET